MLDPRELLKEALKRGIVPKKSLGQHFLLDKKMAQRIVREAGISPEDAVLEIGPGLGSLTFALLEKAKAVVAVELDSRLASFLREKAQGLPLEVVEGDFLRIDLSQLFSRYGRLKAVGNLPYGVSTEILFKLLQAHRYFEDITLMFQWEVAQRIVSPPGTKRYGALSVTVRLFSEPRLLFRVPRGAFWPRPEVQGGVVRFRLHEQPKGDIETMKGLLEGLFSSRRKTILNALLRVGYGPRERIRSLLERASIDPMRRPETLSLEEYLALAESLKEV